jgi:phenylalanyl-tRNA synthetase beta chain
MVLRASARAARLLSELAGGVPAPDTVVAGMLPAPPAGFPLRYARCELLLGTQVSSSEIDRILEGFGLEKLGGTEEQSSWKIPSYRSDLQREVDLIEEVVRVFGINRIRQRLIACGFFEARTSALVGRESLGTGFTSEAVSLKNPLSEDHVALRPSLLPGLLGALERNLRAGAKSVRLFEIGRAFLPPTGSEVRRVAILLSGLTTTQANWRGQQRRFDFFDLKGALTSLGFGELRTERAPNANFALGTAVFSREQPLGMAGQLTSDRAAETGAGGPVFVAELDLPNELELARQPRRFQELQRFPSVARDIALFAPNEMTHAAILALIRSAAGPLLGEVELFDLFGGEEEKNSLAGRKSLAYTLTYRDKNRTLTHDEVNAAHDRIRARLKGEPGVELREQVL